MIEELKTKRRSIEKIDVQVDFLVAGGGMAGVCAAIAAARQGVRVALVQDRPVLGGNASSEVRLWVLGATSHMGNNNRWAREGGIVNEILVENTYRNKEGNPVIFDTVLLDKVLAEPNILLYLNTVITGITKMDDKNIETVMAYNPQAETGYTFRAKYFCDSTGDGLLAYLAGATYRIGAEDRDEFDEHFAQDKVSYGERLGHTIFFYIKDAGKPIKYIPPKFALSMDDVRNKINRLQNPDYFAPLQTGCKYWWIEYGGRLNPIRDTEEIKYSLLSVVYGIWNYVKNSGLFPEVTNYTLEWVGSIPGKRESRRFVGYYMLNQKDIVEQRSHYDTVAFGGWSLDLHPADGVYSKSKKACNQWHSKGVYPIPYRCYITPDLDNVFLAGRIISATHIAFASSRVMATSGAGGEAVGRAAAYCIQNRCTPADLMDEARMKEYQQILIREGVYLPQTQVEYTNDLMQEADIQTSSELELNEIPLDGAWRSLRQSMAQMLPVNEGPMPKVQIRVNVKAVTTLDVELRISSKAFNHTPDVTLGVLNLNLEPGEQDVLLGFDAVVPYTCYAFVCLMKNDNIEVQMSNQLISGIVSVFNKIVPAVSNWGRQEAPVGLGVESFEFWCPERRPNGQNIAMRINPGLNCFTKENLRNSIYRPVNKPNAWVASFHDKNPTITLSWKEKKMIRELILFTDTDYDYPMESVQWGHHDNKMPYCVDGMEIIVDGKVVHTVTDNYQAIVQIDFAEKIVAFQLQIRLINSTPNVPVALMGLQVL